MSRKFFVRLLGLTACVVAFATSNEAEAGRRHRRQCCDPCCEPVCCEPVCVSACAPAACAPACETVAWYDSCGRLVYRRAACCETIVSSQIVLPAPSCCGIAGTTAAEAGSVAKAPATGTVAATTASILK